MQTNLQDKIREDFISRVSKINETEEDEFKAEYNSPELIFPVVLDLLKQTVLGFNRWKLDNNWGQNIDYSYYSYRTGETKSDSELFEIYKEEISKKDGKLESHS